MNNVIKLFFAFILMSSLGLSIAFGADFFVWKTHKDGPGIIMARKDHQSAQAAINEYFKVINQTKSLKALLDQSEIQPLKIQDSLPIPKGQTYELPKATNKPRFIVVTNELRELYGNPYSKRILNVKKRLEAMGAEVYMLPVVHDAALPINEAKLYRQKLIREFDAQLVLGGADIDPYLYGEKTSFAKSVIRHRDLSELKFVRDFIDSKRGMNFGICRGHQMCAVANHKKLYQDIQIQIGASPIHLDGDHFIKIDDSSEIFSVFDEKKLMVNSLHHQAVIVQQNDKTYKVIATSYDKRPVVEAIEFKNGKGITLQFHPELMYNETGDKILKRFVDLTVKNRKIIDSNSKNCLELVKSFF